MPFYNDKTRHKPTTGLKKMRQVHHSTPGKAYILKKMLSGKNGKMSS